MGDLAPYGIAAAISPPGPLAALPRLCLLPLPYSLVELGTQMEGLIQKHTKQLGFRLSFIETTRIC